MKESKFCREYIDEDTKKVVSRWHYDLQITKFGPILVEELDPSFDKKTKRTKKKVAK